MVTTRATRIHGVGGTDVMRTELISVADPGPGEILVRHTAIGVNFIDIYYRSGLYPVDLPSGLGVEAVGEVEQIGPGVTDLSVGDRVAYVSATPGAYAEKRIISADRSISIPDELDVTSVAAILLKGMTVEYLIRRTFPVQPGQTVLWHAASGGVGLIASQWLSSFGVTVIGTVGSDEKASLAREYGCTHTIIYTRENFKEKVMEITDGRGVPVVFDSVGKDTFYDSLDCLSPRGMLVSFGNASGPAPEFAPGLLAKKGSLFITRPRLFDYISTKHELAESSSEVFRALMNGAVRARIHQSMPLEDAKAAHNLLEQRQTQGSVILTP